MLEKLFNSTTSIILNKAMDAAELRNQVIANNIANVNTPNFKRSEVVFAEKLKKVLHPQTNYDKLKTTNSRHIQIWQDTTSLGDFQPDIQKLEDSSYRNDGNNVDIDVEMANTTKNKSFYDAMSQSMSNEIKLLRLAITGR